MVKLEWKNNDFKKERDSSGVPDGIDSNGKLQQGYQHGSLTKGLVAYYPMEQGEGALIRDAALDNQGIINGATWNSSGKIGNSCLSFDGSSNYVNCGDIKSADGMGEITISAWIKLESTGTDGVIASKNTGGGTSSTSSWGVKRGDTGTMFFYIYDSGGNLNSATYLEYSDPTGVWKHVTSTYDGATMRLFIDGVEQATNSLSNATIQDTTTDVNIGRKPGDANYFPGDIDDVRVYNRALSEPEIKALYNSGNGKQSGITQTDITNTLGSAR